MHPGIRVLCLILFGSILSLQGLSALLPAIILIGLVYVFTSVQHLFSSLVMLKRLRFLFISLALIYFWFTPGAPLFETWGNWSPTVEGLWLGSLRILILVLIVLAVHLLLRTSSREELLSAILWVAAPLQWFGIKYQRLAVRLTLVMRIIDQVMHEPKVVRETKQTGENKLDSLVGLFGFHYARVLKRADSEPLEQIKIDFVTAPPLRQCFYPLFLVLCLLGLPLLWAHQHTMLLPWG